MKPKGMPPGVPFPYPESNRAFFSEFRKAKLPWISLYRNHYAAFYNRFFYDFSDRELLSLFGGFGSTTDRPVVCDEIQK